MEQTYWMVGVALASGLAVYAAYAKGMFRGEPKPIHLGMLLKRNGVDMKLIAEAGLEDELVRAAQECRRCDRRQECELCLLNGDATAYRKVCPNAALIDGLKAQ